MRSFLTLGTGTGVGKTWLGAAVLRSARKRGIAALGLKPIESGFAELGPGESDWERLGEACSYPVRPLYGFQAPVSPHLAAELEGKSLELGALRPFVEQKCRQFQPDWLWLETAGAAFSPLGAGKKNLDWVELWPEAEVLLVAPDSLGVLSDVSAYLLALYQSWGRGRVSRVLLSAARAPDASTGSNAAQLEREVFPHLGAAAPLCSQVCVVGAGALEADGVVSSLLGGG